MSTRINPRVVYLPTHAIQRAARRFPTPFFIYEESRIRANCKRFRNTFRRYFPNFAPLFAVKANTNPEILRIIFSEGFGADASSEAEAWITRRLGATGMYTGNYTTADEFRFVLNTGCFRLNLDDASMLPALRKIGVPEFLSFRINPGISQGGMKSLYLAGPDAKFGVPTRDVVAAYWEARALGVRRFGIHAMTGSNVLDERYFAAVAAKLLEIAGKVKKAIGIDFECLNVGGGFGVPYRPEQPSLDLDRVAQGIRRVFDRQCKRYNLREPVLMAEPGRWIMADAGWLVGRVHVVKHSSKTFVGIDAGMNDLPRPAIYGAYHYIAVVGKPPRGRKELVNVVGRLCENNDQFARDRRLPVVAVGDLMAIHNAGAHAYAMGHNYNNRLRSAEVLITRTGALKIIRRAETIRDLFRTTNLA
ncbi:MAG: diaminopimelate decarboxylase [Kiritimatiellae bacterium]|nr:diaminopimelate decarboxylase [Kiritimatiellia bacterium]